MYMLVWLGLGSSAGLYIGLGHVDFRFSLELVFDASGLRLLEVRLMQV